MAKRKAKASCLGAALLFGFVSFLANIGSCGREEPKPTKSTSIDVDSIRLESEENPKPTEKTYPPLPASAIPVATPILARPPIEENSPASPRSGVAASNQQEAKTTGPAPDPFMGDATMAKSVLFPTPSRKWTSDDGRTFLGIVTSFDAASGTANVRTADGKSFAGFPVTAFSEADREYLYGASEGKLVGRVVGVTDGDTLTLLVGGNTQFKIRLESIDAPEIGQEYGNNSKAELGRLVHEKDIEVRVSGLDKYKRTLGWIVGPDGTNVNLALVAAGLAWNYTEYSKSEGLAKAERDARESKRGLWKDWKPMAPWDWRDLQKENAARKAAQTSTASPTPFMGSGSTGAGASSGVGTKQPVAGTHWLNTSSMKRHNRSCRYFGGTKNGRSCGPNEGSACGTCGG